MPGGVLQIEDLDCTMRVVTYREEGPPVEPMWKLLGFESKYEMFDAMFDGAEGMKELHEALKGKTDPSPEK